MEVARTVQEVRLYGRAAERTAVAALLAAATAGHGGALVLRGDPGAGRSAVLRAAAGQATGFTVLAATGQRDETDIAFSGLQRLLAPILPFRPTAQLRFALDGRDPDGRLARTLALALDTLALLRAAARQRPVLCLLDDAHLLDPASRRLLTVVARRLTEERIAVVAALPLRVSAPAEDLAAGLHVRRLDELDAVAGRALLDNRSPGLAEEVAAALFELAGGNPRALVDLAGALTPQQRRGDAPPPVTLPADSALLHHYRAALRALPGPTRWLLLLAAADPDLRPADLFAAAPAGDLEPAEQAGLITVTPAGVRFAPPILRTVTYHDAPITRRRAAHAALAEVLGADRLPGLLPGLLHRAAATAGRDDRLARALTAAADQGTPLAASAAHQYAAELSTAPADAATSRIAAAQASWRAGRRHEAALLLRRATALAPADRTLRAHARRQAGERQLPTWSSGWRPPRTCSRPPGTSAVRCRSTTSVPRSTGGPATPGRRRGWPCGTAAGRCGPRTTPPPTTTSARRCAGTSTARPTSPGPTPSCCTAGNCAADAAPPTRAGT
ncbi:AAA family ATPase [Micromonosporaceae bacterium Da 78-11]